MSATRHIRILVLVGAVSAMVALGGSSGASTKPTHISAVYHGRVELVLAGFAGYPATSATSGAVLGTGSGLGGSTISMSNLNIAFSSACPTFSGVAVIRGHRGIIDLRISALGSLACQKMNSAGGLVATGIAHVSGASGSWAGDNGTLFMNLSITAPVVSSGSSFSTAYSLSMAGVVG
jgi:hypothetical protein